eukprot:4643643-Amphidinium_carterae.1
MKDTRYEEDYFDFPRCQGQHCYCQQSQLMPFMGPHTARKHLLQPPRAWILMTNTAQESFLAIR